ncbi:hypothetical protein [Rhodoferax sp.]|uniref:helix-turn-helix transcriptional regulator n=1 Tax=Rhodoferax sp. TaxID=50421 RepID=UPI002632ABE4|nr:hypothetical protein [Rhodoferax sp.]MDD2808873.1 hypothetical protein [Rhodoferax sp.]MDD4943882.1 hypothetical protein [Rhodoferax sp.]
MKTGANQNGTTVPIPQNQIEFLALWRLPKVLQFFPVSKSAWWAGIAAGKYPPGVMISKRCRAWHAADIIKLNQSF